MLEVLHQLEIAWIMAVQSLSIWFAPVMTLLSETGSENFFMFVMPILYWSFDAMVGTQMATLLLLSNASNAGLKLLFHSSRPYWLSPGVHAFAAEPTFGFPSGHSQTAASIWGFLALHIRDKVVKFLLLLLIFLIGFSRVYLGVHYFSDVVGGWLVGALLIWGLLQVERPLVKWLRTQSLRQMLILALISAAAVAGLHLVPAALAQTWPIPDAWMQNALAATPGVGVMPLDIHGAFTVSGTWFGFFTGLAVLFHRQGGYCAAGSPSQRLLRYLIGLLGIFVFYYALGQIFPREENLISYALRFFRYSLVGLWVSLLAPLIFQRLGLLIPNNLQAKAGE
jgi:membrane-associated phospholipid phosphatase